MELWCELVFGGAIARIGGAQKRAGGVAGAKYSVIFASEQEAAKAGFSDLCGGCF